MSTIDSYRAKMGYTRLGDTFISNGGFVYKVINIICEKGLVHWDIMFSDGSIKRVCKQNGKLGIVRPSCINNKYKGTYRGYALRGFLFCVGSDKYYNVVRPDGTECVIRPVDIDNELIDNVVADF